MYDFETREQFISQRALGKSLRSIAAMLHIHRNTSNRWNIEYENEISAKRRSVIGLALTASGAGRLERAKNSAAIFNRLTRQLLEDNATGELDIQALASYVKFCQLLDKIDPPPAPEPEEEPGCGLPDSLDLLSSVKMPVRHAKNEQPQSDAPIVYDLFNQARSKQQSEHEKPEEVIPASRDKEPAPEPVEANASCTASSSLTGGDIPDESAQPDPADHAEMESAPNQESLDASEQFWKLYRSKMRQR
jgi:hypothetical protein